MADTTVRVDEERARELKDIKRKHDLNSKDEALEYLLNESREDVYDLTIRRVDDTTLLHDKLGFESASPLTNEFAGHILDEAVAADPENEDETYAYLFTLVNPSALLFSPEYVATCGAVSAVQTGPEKGGIAFIAHHLGATSDDHIERNRFPVHGWQIPVDWYETELMNLIESRDWIVPTEGLPSTVQARGVPVNPFRGRGRRLTDEQKDTIRGLMDVREYIDSRIELVQASADEDNDEVPNEHRFTDFVADELVEERISREFVKDVFLDLEGRLIDEEIDVDAIVEEFEKQYPSREAWREDVDLHYGI